MSSFSKRLFFPSIIMLSIFLSGCQFADQLQSLTSTKQQKTADKSWSNTGNIYATTVKYESPGGQEVNTFKITLENGTIKGVQVEVVTEIDASIRYQKQFAQELPKVIVGKKLADLNSLDKISGASLTTDAFNRALQDLKAQM